MKEIGIIIMILSGRTCGMTMIGMDVPDNMELNKAMKQIVKENVVSVEVEEVKTTKTKQACAVSFICKINTIAEAQLILNYNVSLADYMEVYDFYKTNTKPKLAKNNNKAIMLIKNIIESYDPFIQVISE